MEKKKKKEKAGKIIKNLDQRFDRVEGKRNNLETFGTRLETSPWYENCRESHSRLARLDKLLKKFQRSGLSFSALLKVSSIVRPLLLRTSSRRFLCKGKKQKGIVRKIFAIFSISGIRNVDRWIDDSKDQDHLWVKFFNRFKRFEFRFSKLWQSGRKEAFVFFATKCCKDMCENMLIVIRKYRKYVQ